MNSANRCALYANRRIHAAHGDCPGIPTPRPITIDRQNEEGVVITDNRFLRGDPVPPSQPSPEMELLVAAESPWGRVAASLNVLLAVGALTGLACAPAVVWAVWKWALS